MSRIRAGCGVIKPAQNLACTDCLSTMPARLLGAVAATYDEGSVFAHALAVDAAVTWLASRRTAATEPIQPGGVP